MKGATALLVLLLLHPVLAWAQADVPQQEGRVEALDLKAPDFAALGSGTSEWSEEIKKNGAHFVRIRFSGISDAGSGDYEVVLRDFRNRVALRYPKSAFGASSGFWSGLVRGDTLLLQVVGKPELPAGLKFRVSEVAFQRGAPVPQSISEPNDLTDIEKGSPEIQKLAKPVVKLSFVKNDKAYTCTGFMVSDDLLLTNEHCVASQGVCDSATVIFGFQRRAAGGLVIGDQAPCTKYLASDHALDFSLLRVDGAPGKADAWGQLPLCSRPLAADDPLIVIQHPAGEPKQFSKVGCEVKDPSTKGRGASGKTDFSHVCDTKGGSSGSPIVDGSDRVVGLHHLGFSLGSFTDVNRGVKIGEILPKISDHVTPRCAAGPDEPASAGNQGAKGSPPVSS